MKMLAICLNCFLLASPALAADSEREMAKLQGKWQLTSMELRGMKMTADSLGPLAAAVLELGDGKLVIRVGNRAFHEGSFKIDAGANPKTIEGALMAGPRGTGSDKPAAGIYEIEGDTLRICFGAPGGKAPRQFKTMGDGGGSTLNTYRRVK